MFYNAIGGFPKQVLPFSRKTKIWRKQCVDYGDNHSLMHYHVARKNFRQMGINYDLLNGKVHMEELKLLLNPYDLDASFIPDSIQHYSIINSKLKVLEGEECKRMSDFRVVITNPTAISEMEEEKNAQVNEMLFQAISNTAQSDEEFQKELDKINDYFQYDYQDKREVRANLLLNHYKKEQEFDHEFNSGFRDAYAVAEEAYQCDIEGGEPVMRKINPLVMKILRYGNSNRIEDADMIIFEEYWNPGRIVDTYWDQLSKKDIEAIENAPAHSGYRYADEMDNIDSRYGFVPNYHLDWTAGDSYIDPLSLFDEDYTDSLLPYDLNGNVRVMRVFWKSYRKIKKVKSYNPETGEEEFNFYPETYYCDPEKGEEEDTFWIQEAWEGTKIGKDIYVNMGPRVVQYNRLSNPSRCHFGIIGSIYTANGDEPYSLVDVMKPYAYLYDVIHDRLNKILAKNMGKIIRMDFSKVPKDWDVEQWLYYIRVNNIAAEDSFKEGAVGNSTGKLAGSMNNASNGVIDASLGNEIQQYISLLEWIDTRIGKVAGITDQRLGQISNRETVGGVERATLQSSHITEWLFFTHDSVKKRVLECFLETAKIALRGRKIKFEYILPNGAKRMIEVDGDEFAECDYGLVADNSVGIQELNQNLNQLAHAALQTERIGFSTIMKLFTTASLTEKQRMVEIEEKRREEMQQQQQEQQAQLQQQQMQIQAQLEQQKQQMEYKMHQEKLEAQILVAQINSKAEADRLALMNHDNAEANDLEREKIAETARQFDAKLRQDEAKLELEKKRQKDDARLKEKQINKTNNKK